MVITAQPEQQINIERASALGLVHQAVMWRGDAANFAQAIERACRELMVHTPSAQTLVEGDQVAQDRLDAWLATIRKLGDYRP